jgi:hypothetical protein
MWRKGALRKENGTTLFLENDSWRTEADRPHKYNHSAPCAIDPFSEEEAHPSNADCYDPSELSKALVGFRSVLCMDMLK